MLFFQNCGRINTIEVSDLAQKSFLSSEVGSVNNATDLVSAQILQENGTIIAVDQRGNESVVQNSQPSSGSTMPAPAQESKDRAVINQIKEVDEVEEVDESDSDGLDVCEAINVKTNLAAAYQKIKCKKNHDSERLVRRSRCIDLITEIS